MIAVLKKAGPMRRTLATAPRSVRFIHIGLTLAAIACTDSTPPAAPSKLVFTTEPRATVAGSSISPAIVVVFQDEAGNPLTGESKLVSIGVNGPAGASLDGATTQRAVDGVAIFPDLRITLAGEGYTLTAIAPGATTGTSAPFSIIAGPPSKLGFIVQPVTTLGRVVMSPVKVAILDFFGNRVPSATHAINMALPFNPAGTTLSGVTTVPALDGIASFNELRIDATGNGFQLLASAPSFAQVFSAPFNVTFAAPSRLVFGVEPWTAKPGEVMNPAITVSVADVHGNTVTNATNPITVAIGQNPAGGALSGTLTANPVAGVAAFSNVRIDKLGSGYTMTATVSGLTAIETAAFSVRNALTFNAVSSGYFHSCGIGTDNTSYCWGSNSNGELGNPWVTETNVPVPVLGGLTFARISAGRSHSCALTAAGIAYCWGANFSGQLGNGTTTSSSTPSSVSGGLTFAELSAGYNHTCGVTTGGTGYCWGGSNSGEVGSGAEGIVLTPSIVAGGLTFASISPGRGFTCGRTVSGAAYCWGDNANGQVGDGSTAGRIVPAPVQGGLTFASVSAGGFHACGVTTDGIARCWGWGQIGQLGHGTDISMSVPTAVSGTLSFGSISAGNRHTCGVTTGGAAYCWGENATGYLGDGTSSSKASPTAATGGHSFGSISAGRFHSCGVTVASEAYCWGDNSSGRLGIGALVSTFNPIRVR